jgi:Uma2 family endonuclease
LAVEVVSEDDPARDHSEKRADYAAAGIKEYWIVDPRDRTVTVLVLKAKKYHERGVFEDGQAATSALLRGFAVDVSELFDAAKD